MTSTLNARKSANCKIRNQILRKGENHEIRPDVLVVRVVRKQTSVADSKNETQLAFLRLHLNQRKRSGKFTA